MKDFGRGFTASCLAAGLASFTVLFAQLTARGCFRLDGETSGWLLTTVTASAAALAMPATLAGWFCLRALPSELTTTVNVALIGSLLGFCAILLLMVSMGDSTLNQALLIQAVVCGACGSLAGWWSGFRRALRARRS